VPHGGGTLTVKVVSNVKQFVPRLAGQQLVDAVFCLLLNIRDRLA
jgi:hypothetical protein